MTRKTVLNAEHHALGARMIDFGGWEMPISYSSQIEEHHAVRRDAGMFDVSHMGVIDLHGERSQDLLRLLLANDVARLKTHGKAMYACMLNEQGGIIDDLIVYFMADGFYRLVVNASRAEVDLAWVRRHAPDYDVRVEHRSDLAIIAVQGPKARERVLAVLQENQRDIVAALGRFASVETGGLFIARTGYTGEDGFEITMATDAATDLWQRLLAAGVIPVGLGARDTLRLEAGMNLYGQDMDDTITPYQAGLGWTVALAEERDFIGREALENQKETPHDVLIGIVLDQRGMLRQGQRVISAAGEGVITSGSFSPTLGKSIALARVPAAAKEPLQVDMRGKAVPARRVNYPFVRDGEPADDV